MSPDPDQTGERAEIIGLAQRLLVGPYEDDETILSAPADTYLTGVLWPMGAQLGSMEDEHRMTARRRTRTAKPTPECPVTALYVLAPLA